MSNYSVYILECSDGSLYTGCSNNVTKRLHAHNAGKGAKYTKSRRPCRLVYQEFCGEKSEALKREYAIKQMRRAEKQKLAAQENKNAR